MAAKISPTPVISKDKYYIGLFFSAVRKEADKTIRLVSKKEYNLVIIKKLYFELEGRKLKKCSILGSLRSMSTIGIQP